ncbi:hypothetical protein MKY15_20845 [Sporosarcina sp. FSL K6-1540]|uniref:hypothetical protein n=1 Tax=Sporosarcina sp. FSL K6-1540 TaxID=2921555 RepID=UPI00315AB473
MELMNIVEVQECRRQIDANKLLESGWVLLSVGFCEGEVPGYDYHSYSLGLPKDVAASLKPKVYSDGINF